MASLMPCRPFPREPRYKVSMRTAVPSRQCTMQELKFHLLREEDHETGEWTQRGGNQRDLRFKKRIAPSRHSGLSSLSPKEPSSSLTTMSACSGSTMDRMSPNKTPTFSLHSEAFRCCRLRGGSHGYIRWISIWEMSTVNLRYIGAGILLYRIYKCVAIDARNGAQTPRDERSPSSSRHTDNTKAVSTSHVCNDSTSVYSHLF
jgi:hypothetical protein